MSSAPTTSTLTAADQLPTKINEWLEWNHLAGEIEIVGPLFIVVSGNGADLHDPKSKATRPTNRAKADFDERFESFCRWVMLTVGPLRYDSVRYTRLGKDMSDDELANFQEQACHRLPECIATRDVGEFKSALATALETGSSELSPLLLWRRVWLVVAHRGEMTRHEQVVRQALDSYIFRTLRSAAATLPADRPLFLVTDLLGKDLHDVVPKRHVHRQTKDYRHRLHRWEVDHFQSLRDHFHATGGAPISNATISRIEAAFREAVPESLATRDINECVETLVKVVQLGEHSVELLSSGRVWWFIEQDQ